MSALEAAVWGVVGGLVIECLQFASAIRRVGGWPWRWPTEPGPGPLAVSVVFRVAAGAGLAAAAGASSQITTAFGAFALGVTAPLVVEKIFQAAGPGRSEEPRQTQLEDRGARVNKPTLEAEAEDAWP